METWVIRKKMTETKEMGQIISKCIKIKLSDIEL